MPTLAWAWHPSRVGMSVNGKEKPPHCVRGFTFGRSKTMKNRILLILGGVVLCGLVVTMIVIGMSAGVSVETAPVVKGPIHEFVDERAVTRLPETYLITMPFAGRLDSIVVDGRRQLTDWKEGDPVARGEVVARIVRRDLQLVADEADAAYQGLVARIAENADNSVEETGVQQTEEFVKSMKSTVEAAAARVKAGKAKFDYAETRLGRISRALVSGAYSKEDQDLAQLQEIEAGVDYRQDILVHDAMTAMEAATYLMPTMVRQYIKRKSLAENVLKEQTAEAKAHLEQVEQDMQRGTMTSPVDGVVLRRMISNEGYLAAGEPLLEIGRLEDLEVETDILSLDVVAAKVGDRVKIYGPAIGKQPAFGKVHRINPAGFTKTSSLGVEQQRVKVIVHFDPAELERLRQERDLGVGYRVRVQITTAEKPAALTVPRSALFRATSGDWQVYVVRGGVARVEKVEVGLLNDRLVEITSGLADGDVVVLSPESNLSDGVRVRVNDGRSIRN